MSTQPQPATESCLRHVPVFVTLLCTVAAFAIGTPGAAAADHCDVPLGEVWLEVDPSVVEGVDLPLPREFRVFCADESALFEILGEAPPEFIPDGVPVRASVLPLPLPDGSIQPFSVASSPVLSRELMAEYPGLETFSVRGLRNQLLSGRLTATPTAIDALLRSMDGLVRLNPYQVDGHTYYLSYFNDDRTDGADDFDHADDEQEPPGTVPPAAKAYARFAKSVPLGVSTGPELRTYRLAAATTGEYYQARENGGGNFEVLVSMVQEINNANLFFESEVALRLVFTWALLWDDPNTDPYSDGHTACELRDQNDAAISAAVGDKNLYDIGFAFGSGGGNGCAWYVLCDADKERGSGLINTANVIPGGSTGLLAHEMGHQLGAHHTFSGSAGSCTNVEYNPGHGFEPGSGTTVMSYRGNCGSDNVVTTSEVPAGRYYNAHSFDEIVDTTTGLDGTCGTILATGNIAPIVDAGSDYTIPRGTPFTLTGSGSDPDFDPLTFTWEQFDEANGQRPIDTDIGEGPIFRSVQPGLDPVRTFPVLSDILDNTQTPGEILPSMDRQLTFLLVARDNRMGGGGVAYDGMTVTVDGNPFFLTSPNGAELFGAGCAAPVTWQVGGGDVANDVDLLLSDDNGDSFSSLLDNTPNDGATQVDLPCGSNGQARIKAAAVDNIFFDVSDGPFFISAIEPTVSTAASGGEVDEACEFLVEFEADVEDDCAVVAGDISVQVFKKPPGNFTVGPVTLNTQQVSPTEVAVTGSFLVSDLMDGEATMTIDVEALDNCGEDGSDGIEITVEDTTPPEISVLVDPTLLWPPNHKMRDILATVTVTDNCPGAGWVLTSVGSNEPDNGPADGNTVDDIQGADLGTEDDEFQLRAERAGNGSGRLYTATWTATDQNNNAAQAEAVVMVPKSMKK